MNPTVADDTSRLNGWRRIQKEIAKCRECCSRWRDGVIRTLGVGEIPDPPDEIHVLFVGVAPTSQEGPHEGSHFYSSEEDLLRVGLFRLLAEDEFGIPLNGLGRENGNRVFHESGYFFVHATKVRPVQNAAPPGGAIEFCARRHLREEICILCPRVVCFLGKNNGGRAAHALFGRAIGDSPLPVGLGDWNGFAVVTHQPRRGWEPRTRSVLRELIEGRPRGRSRAR